MKGYTTRNLLVVIVCSITVFHVAQGAECLQTSTTAQFRAFTNGFSVCQPKAGLTTFEDEIDIVDQVFDDEGELSSVAVNYDTLSRYCLDVLSCKDAMTTCESKLNDFVKNAGMALCQNGLAMTRDIIEAVKTLREQNCDLNYQSGPTNAGCYLGSDGAVLPTYLDYVTRLNKYRSAEARCMYRSLERQSICTSKGLKAVATIFAASLPLENIGIDYNSYIKYQKPALSTTQSTMSMRGFSHLFGHKGSKTMTCTNLAGSNIFLWNSYIKIDGTTSRLAPMVDHMLLTGVIIQFYDDAGAILDSYTASSADGSLSKQTMRQQGKLSTSITVEVIEKGLIVLAHKGIDTKIAISSTGESFGILVSMPESLVELETVGVLVDGCNAYGGSVVDNVNAAVTAECRTKCAEAAAVESPHKAECAFDCTNGIKKYVESYSNIAKQRKAVESDRDLTGGAVQTTVASVVLTVSALLLFTCL